LKNNKLINELLSLRNIKDTERFMNPSSKDLIEFECLKNISDARDLLLKTIKSNKQIAIYYDVDCDGICSGTIMYRYLQDLGVENIKYFINTGKKHGISDRDITEFNGIDLLIIVDSIDTNYKFYNQLKSNGTDIIILDHHDFDTYPKSAILVSSSKNYPNKHLSGSGVVFKFCAYIDELNQTGYSYKYLDLAACGILADVCEVSEASFENRYIVYLGLKNMSNLAIKSIVGTYSFNSTSVLWSIAPLINSANRTSNNEIVLKLFLLDDPKLIRNIIKQLKEIKKHQDKLVSDSYTRINQNISTTSNVILSVTENKEFSGLIATKLSNQHKKPCIILYTDDCEDFKGSIRGYGTKDFKESINKTNLAKCYGHGNAAGIEINKNNISKLMNELNQMNIQDDNHIESNWDLEIDILDIKDNLINKIETINFINGNGFKPIKIKVTIEVERLYLLKESHTRINTLNIDFFLWNNIQLFNELTCDDFEYAQVTLIGELCFGNFRGIKTKQCIIDSYSDVIKYPLFLRE